MNDFGFIFNDVYQALFNTVGFGFFFGLLIGLFRFLYLTFFERREA